jgi:surfeit locus 1 family protein
MAGAIPSMRPRRGKGFWALLLGAALSFMAFLALGGWQVQRLTWKQDLIARVEQRLAAPPALPPAAGASIERAAHEYRRVALRGEFDHAREALVTASTELGSGHWLLTPLRAEHDGRWYWINRGFLPRRDTERTRPAGSQPVEGLLRLTEPGGSMLQANQPAAQRWYSRDVAALSAAAGLPEAAVAPFFIDVWPEPGPAPGELKTWPHPGLTVLSFSNSHRVYALTWFALAAMVAGGAVYLLRVSRRA